MRKEELIVGERYKYKRVTRDEKTKEQVVKQLRSTSILQYSTPEQERRPAYHTGKPTKD